MATVGLWALLRHGDPRHRDPHPLSVFPCCGLKGGHMGMWGPPEQRIPPIPIASPLLPPGQES